MALSMRAPVVASILLLALLVGSVVCDAPEDLVKVMPGLDGNLGTQYSGYVDLPGGLHFHYMFTVSTGNPQTDPLLLWMNGGPGCSSMEGYLYELGPFHFASESGVIGNNTLNNNPYTWSQAANVIFLETPLGVGFSYSDDGNYTTNDNRTADLNLAFLQGWFKKFPEFMSNDFYVSGESYAGVYVPMLAYRAAMTEGINFKGFITGNPVTNDNIDFSNTLSTFPFLFGHGVITADVYAASMAACANPNSAACNNASNLVQSFFSGYNMYDIYGDCYTSRSIGKTPYPINNPFLKKVNGGRVDPGGVTPPCANAFAANDWLNNPEVQNALHVSPVGWFMCSSFNYDQNMPDMLPHYAAIRQMGYSILTYSGDADCAVPYTGTSYWVNQIGGALRNGTQAWAQWYFNKDDGMQVGGHVTYYDANFTYVTVRGSGHMVPQYRPMAALAMFTRWIQNRTL
jgi:serine carboxypeptidase-like clade 1